MSETSKRLLIADDDGEDQMMLIDAIQNMDPDMKMVAVTNGREVVEYLGHCADKEMPAIMILDYKMPFLNAAEVLEKFQREHLYQDIVKFVWSTSQQPEHINRCIEAGARHYFVKPAEISALDQIARTILDVIRQE